MLLVSKTLPSTVVNVIEGLLLKLNLVSAGTASHRPSKVDVNDYTAAFLSAIVDLVHEIPDELLQISAEKRLNLYASLHDMRHIADQRYKQPRQSPYATAYPAWLPILNQQYGVEIIRDILKDCPDEAVQPGTRELPFIQDSLFRENLRRDISAVNSALENGEFKAATVLGGSAIEALLLWGLSEDKAQLEHYILNALAEKHLSRRPDTDINRWDLHEFIAVSISAGMIGKETAVVARIAKDFRNLIHPGRSQRLNQVCDRGTALAVVSAVEHVVTDLTAKFPIAMPANP